MTVRVKDVEGGYLLRLERGDELIGSLAELMKEKDIGSAAVTGLGAMNRVRIGCYCLDDKEYATIELDEDLEVVGLTGTLSWHEGEPFPHVHLALSRRDFQVTGGHCFEAYVSATLELAVRVYRDRVDRQNDESIGLHLMDF